MTGDNHQPAPATLETRKKPGGGVGLFVAGGVATTVWLGLLATYVQVNWAGVAAMGPNEVGDFLAGAFAPLAFLWLVLGFFQQGVELRNSGEALWLQGEELRKSVEQQEALVSTTREQLAFDRGVVARQYDQTVRRAQPSFKLLYEGVVEAGANSAFHQFKLTNTGKDCFDLYWIIDNSGSSGLAEPGIYNKDLLANGKWGRLAVSVENDFDGELVAIISYRDELNNEQVKRFPIRVKGSSFLIGDEPQELVES